MFVTVFYLRNFHSIKKLINLLIVNNLHQDFFLTINKNYNTKLITTRFTKVKH